MNKATLQSLQTASLSELLPQMAGVVQALADEALFAEAKALIDKFPTEATPAIEAALKGEDEAVQRVLLTIVPSLPFYSKMVVADALEALVNKPNIADLAKKALQSLAP